MIYWGKAGLFISAALIIATQTQAQATGAPGGNAAALFGARPAVHQISLSPDGTRVAVLSPSDGRGMVLSIAEIGSAAAEKPIFKSSGNPQQIDNCHWVGNARLLCQAYMAASLEVGVTYVSRYFSLNADGSDFKMLESPRGAGARQGYDLRGGRVIDWLPGQDNQVLMSRDYFGEVSTGTRLAQGKEGFGVDQVDAVTFKTRPLEQPKPEAREYITDGDGNVRIKANVDVTPSGYDEDVRRYFYRKKDSRDWDPLSDVRSGEGFDPYGIDPERNVAYGLRKKDGRLAVYTKALDGSGTETLVFAHPSVDVTGFVRIGRKQRIIGASFVTDRRETVFFDPAVAKLTASLAKAIPNLPTIQVEDSSQDGNRLLLWAGSDKDPGRYFVFDRTTRQLIELMLSRPWLENAKLADMKPISYPARDGVSVPGYLTLPPGKEARNLPAIVMPHGGPGARDEWGFDWLAQYFANQGYAVLQPNFRGSAGYGDKWFQQNGFQSWRTAISDVNDAGRWLISQGIADPARLSIVGWSYGGYAALQSPVVDPDLFKAIVAIAPVTDLDILKSENRGFTNYLLIRDFIGAGPHIAEGSPAQHADAVKAPVLLFHGTLDSNVSVRHAQLMEDRLKAAGKSVKLVLFDKLDHYLDDSNARATMLVQISDFLKPRQVSAAP